MNKSGRCCRMIRYAYVVEVAVADVLVHVHGEVVEPHESLLSFIVDNLVLAGDLDDAFFKH